MLRRKNQKPFYDSHSGLPLDPDAAQPGKYKWPPYFDPSLQLIVFAGGTVGTFTRYELSLLIPTLGSGWPLATFIVNLFGAFLLGLLLESLLHSGADQGKLRLIRLCVGTGFIGAFTTYSSLMLDTNLLIRDGHTSLALAYALTSVVLGITVCAGGIEYATRRHHRRSGRAS